MYLVEENASRLTELASELDKGFMGQHQYYKRFVAILSYTNEVDIEVDVIKELMKYIKKETGLFSPFRSQVFMLATLLYLHKKDPKKAFDRIKDHFEALKAGGFKKGTYLPLMAYCMDSILFDDKHYDQMKQTGSYIDDLIAKAHEVYLDMKDKHPWITGGDDYVLALLIAYNDKEMSIVEDMYETLNHMGLKKGNDLQGLANILSLMETGNDELANRVTDMIEFAKSKGFKVNRTMYPAMGLIAGFGDDYKYIEKVIELTDELKKVKKFKMMDRTLIFLFAVTIVSGEVKTSMSNDLAMNQALVLTIEQLVMAQVAVMMATISAATMAANS